MSLLDLGAQCSHPHCTTIDFLPTLCPACALPFCGAHISAHVTADNLSRSDASGSSDTVCAGAGSSAGAAAGEVGRGQERQREEWALRVECEVEGCGRRAMEGVAGLTIEASETTVGADGAAAGQGMEEDREVAVIAKRIRCAGCGKAFCVSHRQPPAHSCPAPSPSDTRQAASAARHAHAQSIIARHFPARSDPLAAASPSPTSPPTSSSAAPSSKPGAKETKKAEDARWDETRGGGMKAKREAIVAAHKAKRAAITTTASASASATAAGSTAMSGGDSSSWTGGKEPTLASSAEQANGSKIVTTEELSPTSRTRTLPVTPGASTPAPDQPTAPSLPPPDSNPAQSSSPTAAPAPAPAQAQAQAQVQASTRPPLNPKAEKLWALHVRKIRMAAAPLDPTSASSKAAAAALAPIAGGSGAQPGAGASAGMKRFFEWTVGSAQDVRDWEAAGKWAGKGMVRRAWVPMDMSAGRALDLFLSISKTPRPVSTATAPATAAAPSNNNAPTLGMALLNLSMSPSAVSATSTDVPRTAEALELLLSRSLAEQVEDGTLIVLVRDWPSSPMFRSKTAG